MSAVYPIFFDGIRIIGLDDRLEVIGLVSVDAYPPSIGRNPHAGIRSAHDAVDIVSI